MNTEISLFFISLSVDLMRYTLILSVVILRGVERRTVLVLVPTACNPWLVRLVGVEGKPARTVMAVVCWARLASNVKMNTFVMFMPSMS